MKRIAAIVACLLAWGGLLGGRVDSQTSAEADSRTIAPQAGPIQPGDWACYNYGPNGWRLNDHERTLNRQTIDRLRLQWKFPADGDSEPCGVIHATPAVVDGFVYFGTATLPKFYCIAPTGQVAWVYDLNEHRQRRVASWMTPAGISVRRPSLHIGALVTERGVYFGDVAGVMYGLDRVTGGNCGPSIRMPAIFPVPIEPTSYGLTDPGERHGHLWRRQL